METNRPRQTEPQQPPESSKRNLDDRIDDEPSAQPATQKFEQKDKKKPLQDISWILFLAMALSPWLLEKYGGLSAWLYKKFGVRLEGIPWWVWVAFLLVVFLCVYIKEGRKKV
jgi:hypothetical protein